jgi:DNA polymerase-3 subunit alpha (Gram-positive type)
VLQNSIPYSHRKISNTPFVAFDTETTGFSPANNRIVEIAGVKYQNGQIVEKKTWLIDPQCPIPYWARKVHGITDAMVEGKPTFEEIYPEFLAFTDGCVLMAHNAGFDVGFIKAEIERAGLPFPRNRIIDSLTLFRGWYPDLESHTLEALASHIEVNNGGFHRALADSIYIAHILDDGLGRMDNRARLRDLYMAAGGSPLQF